MFLNVRWNPPRLKLNTHLTYRDFLRNAYRLRFFLPNEWILPSRYIRYGRNKIIIWYSFIVFDLRHSRIPRSARMPRIKRCIQMQFFALCNVIMLLKHVHFLWIIIRTQYHRTRRLFLYLHACCKNVYRSRTYLNIFYF